MTILYGKSTDEYGFNPAPDTLILEDVIRLAPSEWSTRCDGTNPLYHLVDTVRIDKLIAEFGEAVSFIPDNSISNRVTIVQFFDVNPSWNFNSAYTAIYDLCSKEEHALFGDVVALLSEQRHIPGLAM